MPDDGVLWVQEESLSSDGDLLEWGAVEEPEPVEPQCAEDAAHQAFMWRHFRSVARHFGYVPPRGPRLPFLSVMRRVTHRTRATTGRRRWRAGIVRRGPPASDEDEGKSGPSHAKARHCHRATRRLHNKPGQDES